MLFRSIVQSPNRPESVLVGMGKRIGLFAPKSEKVIAEADLPSTLAAMVLDDKGGQAFLVLSDRSVLSCKVTTDQRLAVTHLGVRLGATDRGCFILPQNRRLVSIGKDGEVSIFDPKTRTIQTVKGPAPLQAGPAVHPTEDAWFFADRQLLRCTPTKTESIDH